MKRTYVILVASIATILATAAVQAQEMTPRAGNFPAHINGAAFLDDGGPDGTGTPGNGVLDGNEELIPMAFNLRSYVPNSIGQGSYYGDWNFPWIGFELGFVPGAEEYTLHAVGDGKGRYGCKDLTFTHLEDGQNVNVPCERLYRAWNEEPPQPVIGDPVSVDCSNPTVQVRVASFFDADGDGLYEPWMGETGIPSNVTFTTTRTDGNAEWDCRSQDHYDGGYIVPPTLWTWHAEQGAIFWVVEAVPDDPTRYCALFLADQDPFQQGDGPYTMYLPCQDRPEYPFSIFLPLVKR